MRPLIGLSSPRGDFVLVTWTHYSSGVCPGPPWPPWTWCWWPCRSPRSTSSRSWPWPPSPSPGVWSSSSPGRADCGQGSGLPSFWPRLDKSEIDQAMSLSVLLAMIAQYRNTSQSILLQIITLDTDTQLLFWLYLVQNKTQIICREEFSSDEKNHQNQINNDVESILPKHLSIHCQLLRQIIFQHHDQFLFVLKSFYWYQSQC